MDSKLRALLQQEITRRGLTDDFLATVESSYMPVAQYLSNLYQKKTDTLLVSFNGAQGSGKSTITAFLRLILTSQFDLYTVEVSIDDFYLTLEQRNLLGKSVHPLFKTRGVPGTHDIPLAKQTLESLKQCSQQQSCKIPVFDKAVDDRAAQSDWPEINEKVKIILFEGWCNHAPVQSDLELQQPINELERIEDSEGIWRQYSNDRLRIYHDKLFSAADALIYLEVPSFEKVYEWRGLQEKKLAQKKFDDKSVDLKVMDDMQLKRFIQHYERITRSCLKMLPQKAHVVLKLNAEHGIDEVKIKPEDNLHV